MLDTQRHDRVDDIIIVLFQSFDCLLARYSGLCHDELDVLILDAVGINLFFVVIVLLLSITALARLARLAVAVAGVVVVGALAGELLSGSRLGRGVEVLDLRLAEDAALMLALVSQALSPSPQVTSSHVRVAVGRLVDFGVVDNKKDLLYGSVHRLP